MIIQITDDQMALLEKAFYELNGLELLVHQFTVHNEFKLDSESYGILIDKYTNKFTEVETIKNIMMQNLVIPTLENKEASFTCNFDFVRNAIQVNFTNK